MEEGMKESAADISESSSGDEEEDFHEDEEGRDELEEVKKMSQRETHRVLVWKVVMLVTILVAATVVTYGTFRLLTDSEKDDFEVTYNLFAKSVQDGIQFHFSNYRLATDAMANSIAGAAAAYNQSFPFVTMPDFEIQGQALREKSGIEVFSYSPYVRPDQVPQWINYTLENAQWWTKQSRETILTAGKGSLKVSNYVDGPILPYIWAAGGQPMMEPAPGLTTFAPIWQQSPPPFTNFVLNYDFMRLFHLKNTSIAMATLRDNVMDFAHDISYVTGSGIRAEDHEAFHKELVDWKKDDNKTTFEHPHCLTIVPVYKKANDGTSELVGQLQGAVAWDFYLVGLLPDGAKGITAVLQNTCGQHFTYELEGNSAFYRGAEDLHDRSYDHMQKSTPFYQFDDPVKAAETEGHCLYSFMLYPTKTFEDEHRTIMPMVLAIVVGASFLFMIVVFFTYDSFVQSRNRTVIAAAARATGIVSSMFPGQIRDQLLNEKKQELELKQQKKTNTDQWNADEEVNGETTKAIADFFPDTTVMFADIVGFTAWSSVREPSQVFELLETLYAAFDEIAASRRIFKVETVGDCYVAVAGLPDPRKDHAVAMCRFARECLVRMQELLKTLEVKLGPDTGDLSMRFGLNSGAVTAGVLRGQRSRFQLFGDTMNTASRMESTGRPNMIQVSHDTAELLKAGGKGNWLTPRAEMTEVKGKGMMVTYWLNASSGRDTSSTGSIGASSGVASNEDEDNKKADVRPGMNKSFSVKREQDIEEGAKAYRLVQWNVEIVANLLRRINAGTTTTEDDKFTTPSFGQGTRTLLNEVKDIIPMVPVTTPDPKAVELQEEVLEQLRDFITAVASMYRNNPFHNFEHASHVTMATVKLLSRLSSPKDENEDCTFGIESDPLTQLACVFAAIVHDIDHPGVPNSQLLKENPGLASVYKKSIAEQNSFDLAWNLFMDDRFSALRKAVCTGPSDLARFRQLGINLVMATDIMDKELIQSRNIRWQKAFGVKADIEEARKDTVDRKATVVIEHMLQAADVAHTMQHWHIYRKWNSRLFAEVFDAHLSDRNDKDPAASWYQGELDFFDFCIIPLAKKLVECGAFGVTSTEYLDYAVRNRSEWERRGRDVVAGLVEEARAHHRHNSMLRDEILAEETEGL